MTGADSFLPPAVLNVKRLTGCSFLLTVGSFIGRTGSIANVRAESLAIAGAGSFTIGCAGFFLTSAGRFFVIASTGLPVVSRADFSVTT